MVLVVEEAVFKMSRIVFFRKFPNLIHEKEKTILEHNKNQRFLCHQNMKYFEVIKNSEHALEFISRVLDMNKKASQTLWENTIYIVLAVVFFSTVLYFVLNNQFGSSFYENYYSKEISRAINLAKPGDNITLDVQKATEIAQKNKLQSFSEIFSFDNTNNEICVKLSLGRKKCYSYFNNVGITNLQLKLAEPINILSFTITEKQEQLN